MATSTYPDIPLDLLYYLIWQMQQRQKAMQTARTRQQPGVQLESGGGTDSTGPGPDTAGPMTSAERSTTRSIAGGLGGLATDALGLDGFLGSMAKSALNTGVNMASTAALGIADPTAPARGMLSGILAADMPAVRSLLGLQTHRSIIDQSAADLQGLADKYGYGMPTSALDWGLTTPDSPVGGVDMGGTVSGGLAGVGQAPGDTRDQTGESGSPSGGNSDSSGTSDSTGGSRGTDGPDRKRGGVFRASRPTSERINWGEKGTAPGGKSGETAIFIPDRYQQPGIQDPKERVIRRTLQDILAGRRGSQR